MKDEQIQKILKQTKDIYNSIAPQFSDTRSKLWLGFEQFNKYVKPKDKVLDLGCGNGRLAEIFFNSEIEYLGIDNSQELINIAKQKFFDKPRINFIVGDILNINYNNQFDLVLMIAVLHHIPSNNLRIKVLKSIYKSLRPGGRLIMSNWNLWQVWENHRKFRYWKYLLNYKEKIKYGTWKISDAFVPWKSLTSDNLRYVHSFSKREMKQLLKQSGFTIEKINFENNKGELATIFTGCNLLAVAVKNDKIK